MNVTVKYFASIREALGKSHEEVITQAITLHELRDELIARGGSFSVALSRGRAVRMALNQVLCEETDKLTDGCEVAFFPPVTGG